MSETKDHDLELIGHLQKMLDDSEAENKRLRECLQDALDSVAIFPKVTADSNFETTMVDFGWMRAAKTASEEQEKVSYKIGSTVTFGSLTFKKTASDCNKTWAPVECVSDEWLSDRTIEATGLTVTAPEPVPSVVVVDDAVGTVPVAYSLPFPPSFNGKEALCVRKDQTERLDCRDDETHLQLSDGDRVRGRSLYTPPGTIVLVVKP